MSGCGRTVVRHRRVTFENVEKLLINAYLHPGSLGCIDHVFFATVLALEAEVIESRRQYVGIALPLDPYVWSSFTAITAKMVFGFSNFGFELVVS